MYCIFSFVCAATTQVPKNELAISKSVNTLCRLFCEKCCFVGLLAVFHSNELAKGLSMFVREQQLIAIG